MKKILLSLACASAVVASAQVTKIQKETAISPVSSEMKVAKNFVMSATKNANTLKTSAADGVYYKTPAGSMWNFAERPLYSYNAPGLVLAPWTEYTYVNMSTNKTGTWGIQTANKFIDLTEDTDEANNLIQSYNGGAGGYYAPQYTEGSVTYIPTTKAGTTMINYVDAVDLHSFHPTNVGDPSFYGGGSLENGNLYGAGTLQGLVSVGIDMSYPKPMSPLYVEKVSVWGSMKDLTKDALSGKTLTMRIYNLEDENAEPVVLTCTPEECVLDRETTSSKLYQVNFTKKTVDEISGETVADPFVIDYPAEVIITGFEQEGVNLGLMGYDVFDEFKSDNADEYTTYVVLVDPATSKAKYVKYTDTVVALGFWSMFDICQVETEVLAQSGATFEANGIAVSADGQTFGNNKFSDIKGVMAYTALEWTDATTGEELYWSDDMYDYEWIQNLVVEAFNENVKGYYQVGAVCDPLPAGTDKRYAVIHLNGRGVVSEDIFVLQGNITLEEAKADYANTTGITDIKNDAVKNNNKKFNLAGQQVDSSFKGIVISNGKKAIKKQ